MLKAFLSFLIIYYNNIVTKILLLGEIMPFYSYCIKKGLLYIAIVSPTSHQFSLYAKCIKLNMHSSCDICSAFNIKYILFIDFYNLLVLYLIYYKILHLN